MGRIPLDQIRDLSPEDLRKITWDYSSMEIVGYYKERLLKKWMFEAIDFRSPILVQRCNISEGWVEYLVIEGEEPRIIQDFGHCCKVVRDSNGDIVTKREEYHGRLIIKDLQHKRGEIATIW
jgi:hypothetical protein